MEEIPCTHVGILEVKSLKKKTNDEAGRTVGKRKRRNPAVEVGVKRNYSSMLS